LTSEDGKTVRNECQAVGCRFPSPDTLPLMEEK
jgi:hypothetical protein